jgi:hypothetical protein
MTTTYIRNHGGIPALFLDDQPVPPIVAYVGPRYVDTFRQADVQLFTFTVPGIWWTGPGAYDFDGDRRLSRRLRRAHPGCLLYAEDLPRRAGFPLVGGGPPRRDERAARHRDR